MRRQGLTWFIDIVLLAGVLAVQAEPQTDTAGEDFRRGVRLQQAGRYAEAAAAYEMALHGVERSLGPAHISAARILVNIGTVYALQHDDLEAKAAFERALRIMEQALGPRHVQVGFTLTTLALLAHKQGWYGAAEPLYVRALRILEDTLGPEHERTALLETAMAKLYLVQRRNTEAEGLLERAIPILEKSGKSDEFRLVVALNDLAEAYRRDGRYSKAEPLYARIWATAGADPSVLNGEVRAGLYDYVQMLRKTKRKTEARELETQLGTILP